MSFNKKNEPKPLVLMVAVQAAVGLAVALLFVYYTRGCDSSRSAPIARSDLFAKAGEAARTASPAAAASSATADSLPWLVREKAPQYAREDSARPAGAMTSVAAPAAAPSDAAAAPAPAAPAADLSAADQAALKSAIGPLNADKARQIGSERGLLFSLGKKLLGYPKLVGLILNNDYVVEGFMSQDRVRKNCHDEGALTQYLSNTGDSTGISLGLATISSSLSTPGSAQAIFGSKLTAEVLSQCGSIKALTGDPAAIGQVATANPQMLSMMTDGRLVSALSANPAAMSTLASAQSSLSQSPGPSP